MMKSTKFKGGRIYEAPMVELEHIEYFYGNKGNEHIKDAYQRVKDMLGREPDIFMNAELFDFSTRAAASDVVCDGVVHRLTEGYGLAFPENKSVVFSYKNNVGAKDYIGAYPVLVRNGKEETSEPAGIGGSRGRTALGVNKDNLYIALIPDGGNDATLAELRKAFINAGATDAINLDGGGSTQFYAPNGNHFTTRNVRGFVGIWLKKGSGENEKSGPTVFLSAGHGGKDGGATAYGLVEKEINLQILLSCKAELERHDVKVVCSRTTDENDPSEEEVKEANASGARLAVSFHANGGKGDGFEAYCWSTNKEDKKLAEALEKHVRELGQNSRGIKSGNHLHWCHYTNMTSCLAESFFVDNDVDNNIGDTIDEQRRFGIAYAKGILEYLGIDYIEESSEKHISVDELKAMGYAGIKW